MASTTKRLVALAMLLVAISPRAGAAVSDRTHFTRSYPGAPRDVLPKVLEDLLTYQPGWITRLASSHDPDGGNGDAALDDSLREDGYEVLLHARGEGRITRLWMTADSEKTQPFDYRELWIKIDGRTAYRGKPQDYFWGRGEHRAPLVLDGTMSAGAYTSWVPYPFKSEAKVLFRDRAHYYQVGYRQGPGSSAGPTAGEVEQFLSQAWWLDAAPPNTTFNLAPGAPATIAEGDALVTQLALGVESNDLPDLLLRIGGRTFPASALFSFLGPFDHASTVFSHTEEGLYVSRLPIPLRAGDKLEVLHPRNVNIRARATTIANGSFGTRFIADYRDQKSIGGGTTFPVFEADGPVSFISQVYEGYGGEKGMPYYLEGDEMIRLDRMRAPLLLGTGTEDYFNGGWYFTRLHSNPLSGMTHRVEFPGKTDADRMFELSMYRHHALDPIIARSGMRFGWEAGAEGRDTSSRFRTLSLGYGFAAPREVARVRFSLVPEGDELRLGTPSEWITSPMDAEKGQLPIGFAIRKRAGALNVPCAMDAPPSGATVIRAYDAAVAGQQATLQLDGAIVGRFFEPSRNLRRRYAEDEVHVHLLPSDCHDGILHFSVEQTPGAPWTESAYEVVLAR